jgi:CRISPR/Cas system CMR subunit Cmr6 (Cas7 group RAMP superfamily)
LQLAGYEIDLALIGNAYPISDYKLEIDVATCHYPDYYFAGKRPTDNQELSFTYFWVINAPCLFRFRLYCANSETILSDALQYGLGKRATCGYGTFNTHTP